MPKPVTLKSSPSPCETDVSSKSSPVTEQRAHDLPFFRAQLAAHWHVAEDEFDDWFVAKGIIDPRLQLSFLRTAHRHQLNPLQNHLDIALKDDGQWSIFIPIDGWIYLLHQQTQFAGLDFHQSDVLDQGAPIWMECTIHRKDFIKPITVREYACELQTDHPAWQSIPRRMLRHKVLQEAIRLSFGIASLGQGNLWRAQASETLSPNPKIQSAIWMQGKPLLQALLSQHETAHPPLSNQSNYGAILR